MPQTVSPSSFQQINNTDINQLTGLFSPEVLSSASRNSTEYAFPNGSTTSSIKNGSFSNQKPHRASSASTANSPASSMRFDSSVDTTPEPSSESPIETRKSDPALTTIEENADAEARRRLSEALDGTCGNSNDPVPAAFDGKSPSANSIDWMAQQNGGNFDPVLFGDYRDPQDNILSSIGEDFFNDAFNAQDFSSPYNTGIDMPSEPKRDLMREIEEAHTKDNDDCQDVVVGEAKEDEKYLGYDKIW